MTLEGRQCPGAGPGEVGGHLCEINPSGWASRAASGLGEDTHSYEPGASEQTSWKRWNWAEQ